MAVFGRPQRRFGAVSGTGWGAESPFSSSEWVPIAADPRLFATFWACIVTAGASSRRGYGVVICGYYMVSLRRGYEHGITQLLKSI